MNAGRNGCAASTIGNPSLPDGMRGAIGLDGWAGPVLLLMASRVISTAPAIDARETASAVVARRLQHPDRCAESVGRRTARRQRRVVAYSNPSGSRGT